MVLLAVHLVQRDEEHVLGARPQTELLVDQSAFRQHAVRALRPHAGHDVVVTELRERAEERQKCGWLQIRQEKMRHRAVDETVTFPHFSRKTW